MQRIPYSKQYVSAKDIEAVLQVLNSDFLTTGPTVKEFEEALASYCGARFAVAVSSGTAALHLSCIALGVSPGDEVITSSISFLASSNCVLYSQGKPLFADVSPETGNIDAVSIEKKLNPQTKGIIPVHYGGQPCDLEPIYELARNNGLWVLEDAAHALGASYLGSKIGSCYYSDLTVFSFHPVKTITSAEGGAILTNNEALYKKLLSLREGGVVRGKKDFITKDDVGDWYYEMQDLGFNYRLSDIHSALGLSQVRKIDTFVEKRRELARIYQNALSGIEEIDLPQEVEGSKSAWHLYPIHLKEGLKEKRKEVFDSLREKGIGVQVHYIPIYQQPFYQNLSYSHPPCENAEIFYQTEISLPLYPALSQNDQQKVILAVKETLKELSHVAC